MGSRAEQFESQESKVLGVNNAMSRPNAYVPEDAAIAVPFGANGPFKPSVNGSTMRHFRIPQPSEIQI